MGGQGGCERRIEVFVKIQKKNIYFFFGGGGGEGGGRGGVGLGGGVRVDVNEELNFFENSKKKKIGEGGGHVGSQSIRTQVNSYSSQFVLILVNSYSKFWSIRTHLVNSYSCLVSSYSFWSIRTHFGQFLLKLK